MLDDVYKCTSVHLRCVLLVFQKKLKQSRKLNLTVRVLFMLDPTIFFYDTWLVRCLAGNESIYSRVDYFYIKEQI